MMPDLPKNQYVSIDRKNGLIHITTMERAGKFGPWVEMSDSHYQQLAASRVEQEIGAAAQLALSKTRYDVGMPPIRGPEYEEQTKATLARYNAKTTAQMMKGLESCSVERNSEYIYVTPSCRVGTRGGGKALEERKLILEAPSDAALGSAILKALAISANAPDLPDDPPGYGHT
jgi:hypothetical protein